jgi:DNA-binding Lrp family transcriptional regulator
MGGNMEKAVILGSLTRSFPMEILDNFKSTKGVIDADLVFGPYDFYVVVQVEDKEKLDVIALKIRFTEGVSSTITCNVVNKEALNLVRAHSWE